MKKTILTTLILSIFNFSFSQVNLINTFNNESISVYTNSNETKFYTSGVISSKVKIYNSNGTLYKEFTPIKPVGFDTAFVITGQNIYVMSKNIFNNDSKFEIFVRFSKYNSVTFQQEMTFRIYDEDGLIVKEFGPNYQHKAESDFYIFTDNVTNTNKLRIFNQATNSTEIYGLPSNSLSLRTNSENNTLIIYPNPAKNILTISNPLNSTNMIEIFDVAGKLVETKLFNQEQAEIFINVENYQTGTFIIKIGKNISKFIKE